MRPDKQKFSFLNPTPKSQKNYSHIANKHVENFSDGLVAIASIDITISSQTPANSIVQLAEPAIVKKKKPVTSLLIAQVSHKLELENLVYRHYQYHLHGHHTNLPP
jgi:hypothetical protein